MRSFCRRMRKIGYKHLFFLLTIGLVGSVAAQDPAQNTAAIVRQMRAVVSEAAYKIGRSLVSLCPPQAAAAATVLSITKDGERRTIAIRVHESGPAYAAGLRERDNVISINGMPVTNITQKELMADSWKPALDAAFKGEQFVSLRVKAEGEGSQVREIRFRPLGVCYASSVDLRDPEIEAEIRIAEKIGVEPPTVMAFVQARAAAFSVVEPTSQGASLQTVGRFLNLLAALKGRAMSDTLRDTRPYTQTDVLRADFLALAALSNSGYSIAKYVDYVANTRNVRMFTEHQTFGYSSESLSRLREIQELVASHNLQMAATKASLELPPGVLASLGAPPGASQPVPEATARPGEALKLQSAEQKKASVHTKTVPVASGFAPNTDLQYVPQKMSARGQEMYERWFNAIPPKAVAISGRGAISTRRGPNSIQEAVESCNATGATCALYAVDDQVVWDPNSEVARAAVAYPSKHDQPIPDATDFARLDDVDAVPRLSAKGKELYKEWLDKPFPRAVAISEKGAIARGYGRVGVTRAIENCEKFNNPCRLYAVDDLVVFVPFPAEVPK